MFDFKRHIPEIPDFPSAGILFRDIMPLLHGHFAEVLTALEAAVPQSTWSTVDTIAGVESRGFILAAGLAARRGKGFVPVRKQGKLPPPVVDVSYALEYGAGQLEMRVGTGNVLLVDDVLATGGTLRGAADLCTVAGYRVCGLLVLLDLKLVKEFEWGGHSVHSVVRYG